MTQCRLKVNFPFCESSCHQQDQRKSPKQTKKKHSAEHLVNPKNIPQII